MSHRNPRLVDQRVRAARELVERNGDPRQVVRLLDGQLGEVADPLDRALGWQLLGIALVPLLRHFEALEAFRRAHQLAPHDPAALIDLGRTALTCLRPDEAERAFGAALAIDRDQGEVRLLRAQALEYLGDMAGAESVLREVLADSGFAQRAAYQLSLIKRFTTDDADLALFERLWRERGSEPVRVAHIGFALAKAYEDLGEIDRAWPLLEEANRAFRSTLRSDLAEQEAACAEVRARFDAVAFARNAGRGDPSREPIFIMSLWRSGSSLTDQILCSHPQVAGAGELHSMARVMMEWSGRLPPTVRDPVSYMRAFEADLAPLGAAYLADARRYVPDAPRFTDKMPTNYRWLGTLHMMLPEASLLHVRRDPVDTCLAIYKRLFSNQLGWAFDLREIGRYYRMYHAMMVHWREVLGERIVEVRYEDLVADPEPEIRRMVAGVGLPWDDACLAHHRTERAVSTLSASQVRKPIYKDAVRRWKKYQKHLGPLLEELGDLAEG